MTNAEAIDELQSIVDQRALLGIPNDAHRLAVEALQVMEALEHCQALGDCEISCVSTDEIARVSIGHEIKQDGEFVRDWVDGEKPTLPAAILEAAKQL